MQKLIDGVWNVMLSVGAALTSLEGEFWAAIVGAVVGGIIAYLIQRASLIEGRAARKEERLLADKALGYSLLFKVIAISATFHLIKNHVETAVRKAGIEKAPQRSGVLLPILNLPPAIEFAASEMAMLLSLKEDVVFNTILSLDQIHNSILPVWEKYAAQRDEVEALISDTTFDATEGKSEFTIKPGSPLQRKMFGIEMVANELIRRSAIDLDTAKDGLARLIELLNRRLKLGIKIQLGGSELGIVERNTVKETERV